MKPTVLAIDNGSSSVRAGVFDEAGREAGEIVKVKRSFQTGSNGESELNPLAAIIQTRNAIDRLFGSGQNTFVQNVSFCAFWHSLCGLDSNSEPTTPILGWADTRARDYSTMLKQNFDENETHKRTGAHFHSSFWPAKLLWVREQRPEVWRRTTRWVSFSDLCQLRLFGDARTSVSMASATGMFDQAKCTWDRDLLNFIGLDASQMPLIAASGSVILPSKEAVARWPQIANAEILPAIGDGAADTLGAGCRRLGEAVLMIGTSASMRMLYEGEPPRNLPDGLWSYRLDERRIVVGGALSDGGNLIALLRRKFGVKGNIAQELRARTYDRRLRVEPYFFGERSTRYREDAKGEIVGLQAEHDGIDVILAGMHAIAERLADIAERLSQIAPIESIQASGGAFREYPIWREILEEKISRRITPSNARESSLKGTVLLAAENLAK
ncbi:MAG TPA: FGGY family carbohydrate kinase [Pyrinomonadaceae bacterium]|nr:FGGY family carbohydrate kinase [Pyrinomonadaceae bacterium]